MGMAFPQVSAFGGDPVFQTLVAQRKVTLPQFSFKLTSSDSELFLGGVNRNLFTGSFTQSPVIRVVRRMRYELDISVLMRLTGVLGNHA